MTTYEKTVAVISKPPDLRQDFEIQSLVPWFRKKSNLFAKLKTDICKDIVRNCEFHTYDRDEIIIKQGDRGECFYIIIGGKISIYILNIDKEDENERKALDEIGTKNSEGRLDRGKLGNFAVSLGEGVPFGEVALISDDCIRTATVLADEKTDLVVVGRQLYNRSVRDVLAQEFAEKEHFIKSNKQFSTWAPKYRKQLAMALYKEIFPFDSFLIRQGDQLSNCYFIVSGQVEIQLDPSSHPTDFPKIFKAAAPVIPMDDEKNRKRPDRKQTAESQTSSKRRDKIIKPYYLGVNEAVGDIELLLDLDKYTQSTKCMEKTEVLVLEKKHYERLFVRRHPKTIERMREKLEFKLKNRYSLLPNRSEVPLFEHLLLNVSRMLRPPPPKEKEKKPVKTATAAEREFLNHKGPLVDMFGPGSVFYLINLRERKRQKRNAHMMLQKTGQPKKQQKHVHTVQLPNSLTNAAQSVGAQPLAIEDTVAFIPKPLRIRPRPHSAGEGSPERYSGGRSFRRINSASNKRNVDDDIQGALIHGSTDNTIDDVTDPRQVTVTFDDEDDDDASLGILEQKIKQWLAIDGGTKQRAKVPQLRRFSPRENEDPPRPGNKVVIRKRRKQIQAYNPEEFTDGVLTADDRRQLERLKILVAGANSEDF